MASAMFKTFRDLILARLEQIEAVPEALAGGDPKMGKLLLQAGELLEVGELAELYQVLGLSAEQRNCFISAYTLTAFQSLNKS